MSVKLNILQSVIIAVLLYFLFSKSGQEIKVVEKIVKVTDTVWQSKPQKIKKVYVTVKGRNGLKNIKKQSKEFIYKDTLKNGILNASIFADTIYKRNIELVTFNKKTTIEKTMFRPVFYVAPSITMHKLEEVKNISLNGFISNKKLLFGAGVGLDVQTGQPAVNTTIGFKF